MEIYRCATSTKTRQVLVTPHVLNHFMSTVSMQDHQPVVDDTIQNKSRANSCAAQDFVPQTERVALDRAEVEFIDTSSMFGEWRFWTVREQLKCYVGGTRDVPEGVTLTCKSVPAQRCAVQRYWRISAHSGTREVFLLQTDPCSVKLVIQMTYDMKDKVCHVLEL